MGQKPIACLYFLYTLHQKKYGPLALRSNVFNFVVIYHEFQYQ